MSKRLRRDRKLRRKNVIRVLDALRDKKRLEDFGLVATPQAGSRARDRAPNSFERWEGTLSPRV